METFRVDAIRRGYGDYWQLCVVISVVYVALIFSLRSWMKDKRPFNLRTPLLLWNVVLACISVWMFVKVTYAMTITLGESVQKSICSNMAYTDDRFKFVSLVYTTSKVLEFGDTLFVVLRKTPFNFLHWYHHVTVMCYSWYGYAEASSVAHWFAVMNTFIHSVMYTYYAIKSTGYRIPKFVASLITFLQLVQFVGGLVAVSLVSYYHSQGYECGTSETFVRVGYIVYGSYFLLFGNFFYQRYIKNPPKKAKET